MTNWDPNSKPKYCCWVLNYRCMFKCKMCYIWQTDQFEEETTLDEKKRFIDSLVGFVDKDFEFHLSGGEPLVEKDIAEIIRHISNAGFKTNLVTNGWLVDEEMARSLKEAGLLSLTFSLDGSTAKTHDYLRGQEGSYEKIINAIDMIHRKEIGLSTSVIMLINETNLDEVLPLVDWVESKSEIEMISFQVITQPFSRPQNSLWYEAGEDAFLWPKDTCKTNTILKELSQRRKNGAKIGNHANHFLAFQKYFENPNKFLKEIKCRMGDYEFHVDPYGKVFFCCFTDSIGNIKHDSVPEIWQSEHARTVRQSVYDCKKNCHIMINCFFEDEISNLKDSQLVNRLRSIIRKKED